jgi:uncharacterized membrane protein
MALVAATLGALYYLIWRRPGPTGLTPWEAACNRDDSAAAILRGLGERGRWVAPLVIFLGIYAVLFTAFFTNLLGAISGVAGSLLYWLAQHNVQRGGQPGHYYLFQLGVYEPLLLIFGTVGLVLVALDLRRGRATFTPLLVAWWSIAALGIYAWAGEKMPWLTIHLTVPLTLLAAWAAQRLIWGDEGGRIRDEAGQSTEATGAFSLQPSAFSLQPSAWVIYSCLFAAIVGLSFVLMTAIVGFGATSVLLPGVVPVAALLLIILLTVGASLRWGWRPAVALLAVCLGVSIGLYTARSSFRLSFINGDVPVEPMVYTQTSPDVLRVVRRVEEASIKRGHGLAMPVIYDNETVWGWYLRDFSSAERNNGQLAAAPGPEVMAVFMLQENLDQFPENRERLDGFVIQRYPLRWWFPEDQVYRLGPGWREVPLEQASLLGQLLRAPFDRGVGERWWRFLMFRNPGHPLGSTDFVIAVRPEIADQIGVGLGGDLRGEQP